LSRAARFAADAWCAARKASAAVAWSGPPVVQCTTLGSARFPLAISAGALSCLAASAVVASQPARVIVQQRVAG
jgi:hypothetical protein